MSLIVAKNLYKHYPGMPPVLKSIDLTVKRGEMVAIMGPSGCGKSTMLHVLGLLHPPDSGSLEILGTDVMSLSREQRADFRRNNLGFVMQSYNLFDFSTVFENVEFPLIYGGVPPEERWQRVIRALELVHLSSRIHYRSNRLSGGEQQRVAIARAMVNSPRILLADEPTGALDAKTSKKIMENFCTLAHDGGVAMIVVTHDSSVAEYCDTAYTLEDGILNCTKKSSVENYTSSSSTHNLLSAPKLIMNTACITTDFPNSEDRNSIQDVLNIYSDNILGNIYSTNIAKLLDFEADQSGLPLAIQHISILDLFSRWRMSEPKASINYNHVLKTLLGLISIDWYKFFTIIAHIRSVLGGVKFAQWAMNSKIEHFYAIDAKHSATAALIASTATNIPFSFTVKSAELGQIIPLLALKAEKAVFVRCDTANCRKKVLQLCPDILPEKVILLKQSLTFPINEQDVYTQDNYEESLKSQLNILVIGDMVINKGYIDVLKACSILKQAGLRFKLHMLGKGYLLTYLKLLRLYLKLSKNVNFYGHIEHDSLKAFFDKSNIFITAHIDDNRKYNFSSSTMEAMQFALPIIATDTKNNQEILINKKNALIIKQNSPQAIANAIIEFNTQPALMKTIGNQAQIDALKLFDKKDNMHDLSQAIFNSKKK